MISSLLNHSPIAPRVSHRPSASPQKSNGSGSNAERPALVDDEDDDVVEIEVSVHLPFPPSIDTGTAEVSSLPLVIIIIS